MVWVFGVYYEASIGCVTAIIVILLLIWKWRLLQSRFDKVISVFLLVFSSFICFGYRANAFSILPALFIVVWLREKKFFVRTAIICSIFLGFVCSSFIPKALNINTMSSYAAGFAWEIVSTIQSMDAENKEKYNNYLDDIFGEGATAKAVKNSSYNEQGSSINSRFNDSHQREVYVNYFLAFMEFMVVFRRPWIMYLLCLILILI